MLRLVAAGSSNQEIALTLGVSPVTIDNHVQHILDKLEVHSRLQAVLVARSENLLQKRHHPSDGAASSK